MVRVRIGITKDRIARAQVLEALRGLGPRTAVDVATTWSCEIGEAKAVLDQLVREGVLRRSMQGASPAYEMIKPHTPGPWEATGWYVRTKRTVDGGGFLVADCSETVDENGSANAALVAAAPELLDACRAALNLGSYAAQAAYSGAFPPGAELRQKAKEIEAQIRAAIEKATGGAS